MGTALMQSTTANLMVLFSGTVERCSNSGLMTLPGPHGPGPDQDPYTIFAAGRPPLWLRSTSSGSRLAGDDHESRDKHGRGKDKRQHSDD
ncbi:hypothetical protein [Streptomyces sp. NPDC040750]|uniref:hypothetical protein n=1 Tax=Streptomyces sp. NPDC040750 TaxID=3154491 RepID=UPI0033CBF356